MKENESKNSLAPPSNGNLRKSPSSAQDLGSLYEEHHWSLEETSRRNPESNINIKEPAQSRGLTPNVARDRLEKDGPNRLPAAKEVSDLKLFLSQFLNQLWILLAVAALLSFIGYFGDKKADISTLIVGIVLILMIVIMCFISFTQEREARKVVRGFENLLPQQCTVIRDSNEMTISAEDLVVGDIIRIKSGIRVPADARVIVCSELRIESSSITGESEPVEYHAEAVDGNVPIFEARNVAFNGSMCVDGDGTALVIKTGSNTIIGHIAMMTTNQKNKKSRLQTQINVFVKFLTVLAITIAIITFVAGGFVQNWTQVELLLITAFTVCAVAIIPEGLPATVTSILTLVARRLAQKNVYLKRLDIVEALGSANIIASDKTGTLTKNEMTVTDLWYSNEYVTDIPENKILGGYKTMTMKTISKVSSPLSDLLVAMTICNTASFETTSHKASKDDIASIGSATYGGRAKVAPVLPTVARARQKRAGSIKIDMPVIAEEPQTKKFTSHVPSVIRQATTAAQNGDTITQYTLTQTTVQRRRRRIQELIQGKQAIGAPSEVALIKYAEQLINVHEFRRRYQVVFEIPFNSRRKFHLVVAKLREIGNSQCQYLMMMKGAPEIVIRNCDRILGEDSTDGGDVQELEMNQQRTDEFQKAYQTFGEHGRRVIGFAHKFFNAAPNAKFDADDEEFIKEMVFLGVCAIMDPPRDETKESIRLCKEAGIRVFMVTGDHHITATAIARQIGLLDSYKENGEPDWDVVKGEDVPKLSTEDWDLLLSRRNLVFARTTPEHKYRIVQECQQRGQIISMTGDGVNDAPALKKSDIGVGMGSGSDVAKQAADIVLVDDNFSSMVSAVEEGRLMFDNIKKMMLYILTHAFPEMWGLFVHYIFGMPIGITALQILSIDLVTEIPPGIALCKEPIEGDIMKLPPRKKDEILISKQLLAYCYLYTGHLQALTCFLSYATVFWINGIGLSYLWMSHDQWRVNKTIVFETDKGNFTYQKQDEIGRQASSAWHVGIVLGQVFHMFSCRTLRQSIFKHGLFSNMSMNIAIIIEIVLLCIFVYVPGINELIGGGPVPWECWLVVGMVGLVILTLNEIRKYALRNLPTHPIINWFRI